MSDKIVSNERKTTLDTVIDKMQDLMQGYRNNTQTIMFDDIRGLRHLVVMAREQLVKDFEELAKEQLEESCHHGVYTTEHKNVYYGEYKAYSHAAKIIQNKEQSKRLVPKNHNR